MKRLLDIITDASIIDNPSAPTEEVGTFVLDMARCPGGVPDCILERFPNIPKIHAEDLTKVTFYAYWTKEGVTPALAAYELDREDVCCGIRSNSTCMLGDILRGFPEVRERLRSMGKKRHRHPLHAAFLNHTVRHPRRCVPETTRTHERRHATMTDYQASKLHKGDEVTVNETGTVATVLQSYTDENGDTKVQTDYDGFTEFYADEIS